MLNVECFILLIAFCLWHSPSARAATINAASLSSADVQTALNAAQAGDTVQLPAGSVTWTSGVSRSVPANVTLKGAGTTATGGGNFTVINDGISGGSSLLSITIPSTGNFRLSGITFQSAGGGVKDNGTVNFEGPNFGGFLRIDHCTWNATQNANYKAFRFGTGVFGVVDHCILNFNGTDGIYLYNARRGSTDTSHNMGNYEWSQPTDFGGQYYLYIEDCIVNGSTGGNVYDTRLYDGFTGSKVVARFNTLNQSVVGETHATGHAAQDDRGLRSHEIYGNLCLSTLQKDPNFCLDDIGNGTALVWGNTASGVYKNMILFKVTRAQGRCDPASCGTYNQLATPSGWGYAGTQWNGTGSMWDGGTALGTDTVLGYPCLDMPGRGQGDLLVGVASAKVNNVTGTIRWPNQAHEPVYLWNNTGNIASGWGGNYFNNQSLGRVVENRDYYPQAAGIQTTPSSPFNGTVGTGWGTLANRPTTCTPGVAYWATDVGSWNTSSSNPHGVQQNGSDGVLYKCLTANVWSLYYTPYTYPHPLAGGETPPDTTPPVFTSTNVTSVTSSSFQVNWTTDELTTNAVDYGTSTAYSSGTFIHGGLAASFSQNISGLNSGTLYYVRLRSGDAAGNKATNTLTATTSATDSTPPAFSATNITSITDSGATMTATVVESAKSGVTWGYTTATSTGSATNGSTFGTSLSVTFSGATANTLVYVRFWVQDAAGNTNSVLASFTTTLAPGFASTNISNITVSGATMSATLTEPARSGTTWGYTSATSTGTTTNSNFLVSPSHTISGATANTLVYVRFWASDTDSNTNSVLATFTTSAAGDTGAPVFPPALILK